jgi:hypothetical protein
MIDTINVDTDVSVHNQEDVSGMVTDGVFVLQEAGPEVSQILR